MPYTPDKDIIEPYTDGSGVKVIAKAGQSIPWAMARELGLVEGDEPQPKARKPAKSDDASG